MYKRRKNKLIIGAIVPIFLGFLIFIIGIFLINFSTKPINQDPKLVYYIEDINKLEDLKELDYYDEKFLKVDGEGIKKQQDMQIKNIRYLMIGLFTISVFIIMILYIVVVNYLNKKELKQIDDFLLEIDLKNKKLESNKEDINLINRYLSHELKNSLAVLQGKIYLRKDDSISFIKKIDRQIDDINAITKNNITILEEVNLIEVLNEVKKQINKDFKIKYKSIPIIEGSNLLIERMFYNIIENAFKYGAKDVEVFFERKKNNIVCVIKNDGPKIESEELDNIFNLEYRINPLNKSGSGIGLSLVKNIIYLHSGSIYVESDENNTKFYLSIPLKKDLT